MTASWTSNVERELPHQPWLEHSLSLVVDPCKTPLRLARGVNLDIRAVYVTGYVLGRLLEWQRCLTKRAPDFLRDAMENGIKAGAMSYVAPKFTLKQAA